MLRLTQATAYSKSKKSAATNVRMAVPTKRPIVKMSKLMESKNEARALVRPPLSFTKLMKKVATVT